MSEKFDLIIIGGGIASLSAAFHAQKRKLNYLLIEAQDQLGGAIKTEILDGGFIAEKGPNSLAIGACVQEIIDELGLQSIKSNTKAKNKYIYFANKFHPVSNLAALFSNGLLNTNTLISVFKELFLSAGESIEEESVATFATKHFGLAVYENLLWPLLSGIYAGDPSKLSLKGVFPKLAKLEKEYGSLLKGLLLEAIAQKSAPTKKRQISSFPGGLSELVYNLQKYLGNSNILLNSPIQKIKISESCATIFLNDGKELKTNKLIVATQAYAAASILQIDKLKEITYSPVATLTIWCSKKFLSEKKLSDIQSGFGFLSSKNQETHLLGVIFNSSLFPNRSPEEYISLTCFMGGASQSFVVSLPEEEIKQLCLQELKKAFCLSNEAEMSVKSIKVWPKAIPQYNLGYADLMKQIQDNLPKQIKLAGNYVAGVSIEDTCLSGKHAVDQLFPGELKTI
jgi:oxygen-dependent protoporphyrinogen oxidase